MLRRAVPWLGGAILVLCAAARAADPPDTEQLPAPREVVPSPAAPPMVQPPPMFLRPNRWAHWQYYSVDQFNQWRPRVVYSPYGDYYYYNGAPYPWLPTHNRYVSPSIMGTPYRSE
jgi:hypothetical protein